MTNKLVYHKPLESLSLSDACLSDVEYLRTRSRWTQRMEDELIRLHRAGTPPNIFDWPDKDSTLRDLGDHLGARRT